MKGWQAGPIFPPLVGSPEPKRSLLKCPRVTSLHLLAECFNIHGVRQNKVGISMPSIYGTQHGCAQLVSKNIHQRVKYIIYACRIVVVVVVVFLLLSHVNSLTSWAATCQVPLSSTISWSLLKFISIELVRVSNHFILCYSLLLLASVFPSTRVFSNESTLCITWPKYWSFSISPSSDYSALISFRID